MNVDEDAKDEPGGEPTGATDATEPTCEEPGLEERLARLEVILARMESDDVPLEEALRLFEEGVAHVRSAERILAETELRVEELLAGDRTAPMDLEAS